MKKIIAINENIINISYISRPNPNIMITLVGLLILALVIFILSKKRVKTPEEEGIQ
jgi:LPXTG-motif cell wall-anchored protein